MLYPNRNKERRKVIMMMVSTLKPEAGRKADEGFGDEEKTLEGC